jgi:hypothetical protein
MRKRIRALLLDAAVVCGTLLVCVALLEAGLRIYNPFPFRIKGNKIVLTGNRVETYYSRSFKLEPVITVTRNSLGFRGPNPPPDLNQRLSIVTVGGSTTECRFLSDAYTWPSVLERRLEAEFPKVWLNNAGLDGHSTFGHQLLLRDHILPLRPKVALFLVGFNDQAATAPLALDQAQEKGIRTWSPWQFTVELTRNSELLNTVYNLLRYSLARKAQLVSSDELDLAKLPSRQIPEAKIAEEVNRHERLYIPLYRERLKTLVATCREHGILPVLITQPLLWGSGIDDATGVNLESISDPENPGMNGKLHWRILEAYNRTTLEVANSTGALGIDLAHKLPKRSIFFYDWCHYTARGAAEVADRISAELIPWLAREFPSYTSDGFRGTEKSLHQPLSW